MSNPIGKLIGQVGIMHEKLPYNMLTKIACLVKNAWCFLLSEIGLTVIILEKIKLIQYKFNAMHLVLYNDIHNVKL